MNLPCVFSLLLVILLKICTAFPTDNRNSAKGVQSVYGQTFDEIVVESSLTVRRKNDSRQGRNKNVASPEQATVTTSDKRVKRQFLGSLGGGQRHLRPQFPTGGASAADAQAQTFDVNGPLGGFGASATGAQTQSVGFGPGGLSSSAGLSGSQQYRLPNGGVIDVSFGNTFSSANGSGANAGSSAVTLTNPDGTKTAF